MGKSKLREFLQDLGTNAELRIHQHQNGSKPVAAAISLTTSVAISKSQRKKQNKKRSLLKKVGITPDGERRREVETIVFKNSSGKATSNSGNKRKDKQSCADADAEPIDIRKASFEVMKFSINAMKGSEKEDAETKLAISLGAEPPKNKYLNYKDLQQIRIAEKQAKEIQDKNSVKPDLKPRVNKKAQNRTSSSGNGKSAKSRTNQKSNKIMKRPFKSKMKNSR